MVQLQNYIMNPCSAMDTLALHSMYGNVTFNQICVSGVSDISSYCNIILANYAVLGCFLFRIVPTIVLVFYVAMFCNFV